MKSLKVLSIIACLIMAGMFLMPLAQAQDFKGKVAYVDLARMFDEYEKTKAYDKVLEADNKKFQEERTKKIDAIRDLQGKSAALKEDEKAKAEKDIEKLKAELLAFDQQKRTDLTKARDEKVREILMEIEKTVSEYAKKEAYAYVFNDRVLIYGDQSMNITEPILKGLNEAYTKQNKK